MKSLSDDVKHFFLERQKNLEGENNMLKEDKKRLQDDLRKSAEAHKTQMKAKDDATHNDKKELSDLRNKNTKQKQEINNMRINPIEKRHASLEAKVASLEAKVDQNITSHKKLEAMLRIIITAVAPQATLPTASQPTAAIMHTTAVVPTASQATTAVVPTASQAAPRIMRPSQGIPQGAARKTAQ